MNKRIIRVTVEFNMEDFNKLELKANLMAEGYEIVSVVTTYEAGGTTVNVTVDEQGKVYLDGKCKHCYLLNQNK